jgi:hypothetical protein
MGVLDQEGTSLQMCIILHPQHFEHHFKEEAESRLAAGFTKRWSLSWSVSLHWQLALRKKQVAVLSQEMELLGRQLDSQWQWEGDGAFLPSPKPRITLWSPGCGLTSWQTFMWQKESECWALGTPSAECILVYAGCLTLSNLEVIYVLNSNCSLQTLSSY